MKSIVALACCAAISPNGRSIAIFSPKLHGTHSMHVVVHDRKVLTGYFLRPMKHTDDAHTKPYTAQRTSHT